MAVLQRLKPCGVASGIFIDIHYVLSNLVVVLYSFHAMRERATGSQVFQNRCQETKGTPTNARQSIDFPREFGQSLVSVPDETFCLSKMVIQHLREHLCLYAMNLEQRHGSLCERRGGLSEVLHGFSRVVDAFRGAYDTQSLFSPFRRLIQW